MTILTIRKSLASNIIQLIKTLTHSGLHWQILFWNLLFNLTQEFLISFLWAARISTRTSIVSHFGIFMFSRSTVLNLSAHCALFQCMIRVLSVWKKGSPDCMYFQFRISFVCGGPPFSDNSSKFLNVARWKALCLCQMFANAANTLQVYTCCTCKWFYLRFLFYGFFIPFGSVKSP